MLVISVSSGLYYPIHLLGDAFTQCSRDKVMRNEMFDMGVLDAVTSYRSQGRFAALTNHPNMRKQSTSVSINELPHFES